METGKCIFCDILSGKAPAAFVYKDEICAAFMDIRPANPGHVLVVPYQHTSLLSELDPHIAGHTFQVGARIDQALRESGIRCEDVNMFVADGPAAGQEIPHFHLHVFPRFNGDGFGLEFNPSYFTQRPTREELARQAKDIADHIKT